MPFALALETSSRIGSLALVSDGQLLAEHTFEHGLKHAAEILPILDSLTRTHGLTPKDLKELYVSTGPGSFTGLRIGITLAKTLAFAQDTQLVSVPTPDVLAQNAPPEATNLVLVLDAKRDQIFTARYHRDAGGWQQQEPPHVDTLTAILSRSPRPVHLLGEGLPFHQKFLPANDPTILLTPEPLWRPRASTVARLGHALARQGHFIHPDHLAPLYIRKPEAEEKWDAAHAGEGVTK